MTAAPPAAGRQGAAKTALLEPRHVEVLDLVAEGLPNHEIARRLRLRPNTVATRVESAARILGTADRAGMVGECYRRGVFAPRPLPSAWRPALPGAHLLVLPPLVAQGLSQARIAVWLDVSEGVVKARLAALFRLLGAANRAQLVRRAVDAGFMAPDFSPARGVAPRPVIEAHASLPEAAPESPLTPAQGRVLELLALGLEMDAVATRLRVGPGAAREALREAMVVLRARTLPHAVLLACQAGILPRGVS